MKGLLLSMALPPPPMGPISNWKQGTKSTAKKERWDKREIREVEVSCQASSKRGVMS